MNQISILLLTQWSSAGTVIGELIFNCAAGACMVVSIESQHCAQSSSSLNCCPVPRSGHAHLSLYLSLQLQRAKKDHGVIIFHEGKPGIVIILFVPGP